MEENKSLWSRIPNYIKAITGVVTLISASVGLLFQLNFLPIGGDKPEIDAELVVASPRAYFHSEPKPDAILKSYVVLDQKIKVDLVSEDGDFVYTQYLHDGVITKGYIKLSDLRKPK